MTTTARAENVLDAVKQLSPLLDERAQEAERLRTIPSDVVEALRDAGVFKLALPRSLGGLECDPPTIVSVVEELSRANGSAGWTGLIGNTTSFLAWLDAEVASRILEPNPEMAMAGLLAPMGKAVPDADGGFRVTGRWAFNSGVPHSDYLCCGVMVMDGEAPRLLADGVVDVRFAYFPVSQATIHDTWRAAGLKGTGSHDLSVEDIVVPEERTANPFGSPARHDGPLYRLSFWSLLMTLMAGFPLGVARRALDEFNTLAQRKSRSGEGAMAEDAVVEVEFAHAEAKVQAARALVLDALEDVWRTALSGESNPLEERVRLSMATLHGVRACTEAVDTVFRLAGGGALYDASPLQRCFRDLHAGGQHIALGVETWKRVGKALLGVEQPTHNI